MFIHYIYFVVFVAQRNERVSECEGERERQSYKNNNDNGSFGFFEGKVEETLERKRKVKKKDYFLTGRMDERRKRERERSAR